MHGGKPGILGQDEAKVGVRPQDARLPIAGAALVEQQGAVGLQQGVQAVEHGGRAQVGVLQQHPLPRLDGLGQGAIHPLKPACSSMTLGQAGCQLAQHDSIRRVMPALTCPCHRMQVRTAHHKISEPNTWPRADRRQKQDEGFHLPAEPSPRLAMRETHRADALFITPNSLAAASWAACCPKSASQAYASFRATDRRSKYS